LDLKFHDIPNTVGAAIREATRHGVFMLNIHASGGLAMALAAPDAATRAAGDFAIPRPLCLGVTVLTSLDRRALQKEVGVPTSVESHVLHLAGLGREAGLDGCVASAQEISALRLAMGARWVIVTPGIRWEVGAAAPGSPRADDQVRIASPRRAIAAGADYLVVGRPSSAVRDPATPALATVPAPDDAPARRRASRPVPDREMLDLYEATGALLRGHFRLTSGLHSDIYLQSALVLQYPAHAAALGAALATSFRDDGIQTVLAPAIGGILVAHEVARALGVRGLFTEREDGVMRLRRGFSVARGERCLVVEDVMTTGGSIREVVTCVEALDGVVVGVGSLIDRSGGGASFPVKRATLATVKATTWKPEECPLCRAGGQAIKPGSRA